ncbi:MAG TPA: hypothetical protein VM735_05625 [Candidatus Kapabacteria bacterium]|nr:hypothetical protein [Candidatus Kapabacteria bacterium]
MSCSRRLHHSLLERLINRFRGGGGEVSTVQVVVFCVGIAVTFLLIFLFSFVDLPHLF